MFRRWAATRPRRRCNTTTGSQLGADQAAIRAIIEDINDGMIVIMPTPCAFKFTIPTN